MSNQILENEAIKYKVMLNGQVLKSNVPLSLAESFVATLAEDQQPYAQIVPVASNGQQVLFE